jgi:hypothetical protein
MSENRKERQQAELRELFGKVAAHNLSIDDALNKFQVIISLRVQERLGELEAEAKRWIRQNRRYPVAIAEHVAIYHRQLTEAALPPDLIHNLVQSYHQQLISEGAEAVPTLRLLAPEEA